MNITGISASSTSVGGDVSPPAATCASCAVTEPEPEREEHHERGHLQRRERVLHESSRPQPAQVDER